MTDKFKQFRESLTSEQFSDVDYLEQRAKEIEADDNGLAARIRVRIHNLTFERILNSIKKSLGNEGWNNAQLLKDSLPNHQDNPLVVEKLTERIAILEKLTPASLTIESPLTKKTKSPEDLANSFAPEKPTDKKSSWITYLKGRPFIVFVIIPVLLFTIYQLGIASERYESQAKVLVQQPDASSTLDSSMAILTGLGVNTNSGSDSEIAKTYIYSMDMLKHLDNKLSVKAHYQNKDIDFASRLPDDDQEAFLEYYQQHITVTIDASSGAITIAAQGFTPEFAESLVNEIVKQAEWYINSIGHQLAEAQLSFVKKEHENIEQKLQKAQTQLLIFQQQHNLLDPTSEGVAIQQIAYTLEGQISAKEAELKSLRQIMNESSPRVSTLKHELEGLKQQLVNERKKLAQGENGNQSVGDILADYTDLKVKMDLALQAYTASQVSLEKSRIEAYRKLKYLVTIESATTPEKSKYPDIPYNITLFFVLLSMAYGIGKIIISTIKELG